MRDKRMISGRVPTIVKTLRVHSLTHDRDFHEHLLRLPDIEPPRVVRRVVLSPGNFESLHRRNAGCDRGHASHPGYDSSFPDLRNAPFPRETQVTRTTFRHADDLDLVVPLHQLAQCLSQSSDCRGRRFLDEDLPGAGTSERIEHEVDRFREGHYVRVMVGAAELWVPREPR